ncbi:MAG: NAD(+)/NADH kinase [SAR202 cluster bacterium]|nr:NAD(+) kinase [Chloroflexota bacterium]MQG38582.1 NAD(+)/NADH kinase [SAR202 cluster bacterium]|tara:strand:- start:138 stop:965 length:828 start_codon:yes stop_codon:yes gene_type:complete
MVSENLIGFIYKENSSEAMELVGSIIEDFGLENKSWVLSSPELREDDPMLNETALIIVAGGDGTILKIAGISAVHSIPIVGINLGRVGFMTEIEPEEIKSKLSKYLALETRLEKRMMLKVNISGIKKSGFHALNDVVISHSVVGNLIDLSIKVDDVFIDKYRADGVIIASPTGSTAYSFSAGGPIIFPEAKNILIQPLVPHMKIGRAMVISAGSRVEVGIENANQAIMTVDGKQYETPITQNNLVTVSQSPYVATFLREKDPKAFYKDLFEFLSN